jgi:hypothetical protein
MHSPILSTWHHIAVVSLPVTLLAAWMFYGEKGRVDSASGETLASFGPSGIEEAREIFFRRLDAYQEGYHTLSKTTYSWVLIGFTILILAKESKGSFELLGTTIPPGATHAVVVCTMLYLWLQFGSTLERLIDERIALWKLATLLERNRQGSDAVTGSGETPRVDSIRSLVVGMGMLDVWFWLFLREHTLGNKVRGPRHQVNSCLGAIVVLVSATMIGLAHASAFVLLWDAGQLWNGLGFLAVAIGALQFLVWFVIACCYLYFQLRHHGRGYFFPLCAFAACVSIELLPRLTILRR